MDPDRLVPAERSIQQHVLGGGRDPLLAANDVADLHEVIVDHVGQVIGGKSVGLDEDLVVDLVGVDLDRVVAQQVVECDRGLARDLESNRVRLATLGARRRVARVELATLSVVSELRLLALLLLAELGQSLFGTEAAVGPARLDEPGDVLAVDLGPLRLAVGPVIAPDVRSLVPLEPDPPQRGEDRRLARRLGAALVGVFDPQDEPPARGPGEDVVEQRHVGGADVGVAGRRRRDPDPDRSIGAHGRGV